MVAANAQPSGQFFAKLNSYWRFSNRQGLGIGIHGNEFHTLDFFPDHAGYRVAAATTQANNFDFGRIRHKT
jgi:hypothetical protein